jgi:hypothetical protein
MLFYITEIFVLLCCIFFNERVFKFAPDMYDWGGQTYTGLLLFIRQVLNFSVIDTTTKEELKRCFSFCLYFIIVAVNLMYFNNYL